MLLCAAAASKQPEVGRGFVSEEIEQVLALELLLGTLPVALDLLALSRATRARGWGPAAARGSPQLGSCLFLQMAHLLLR